MATLGNPSIGPCRSCGLIIACRLASNSSNSISCSSFIYSTSSPLLYHKTGFFPSNKGARSPTCSPFVLGNNTAVLPPKKKREHTLTASIVDLFSDAKMKTLMTPSSLLCFQARKKNIYKMDLALSFLGSGKKYLQNIFFLL